MKTPLVTTAHTFSNYGSAVAPSHVFAVNPNINAELSLNHASDLLAGALEPIFDAGMGQPLKDNQTWLVHHSLASAKAIVDSIRANYQFDEAL